MLPRHRRPRLSTLSALAASPARLAAVLSLALTASVVAVGRPEAAPVAAPAVAAESAESAERSLPARPRPAPPVGASILAVPTPAAPAPATQPSAPAAVPAVTGSRRPRLSRGAGRKAGVAAGIGGWSGYAFDACRAPRQRVMDRWLTRSPFVGVGIYLGGIHRACEQRHLTRGWIARQERAGWNLMPIWVGPQASCTGYDHRISPRPGGNGRYPVARAAGARQARLAATTARRLGVARDTPLFYDIEPFSTDPRHCRGSALAFLEAWTREVHRRGYGSGVYSHVNAAISLLSRTPAGYARPDVYWYAWITRAGRPPRRYVRNPALVRAARVHQYRLDTPVRMGGIRMAIDWNHVTIGVASLRSAAAPCGRRADRTRPRPLRLGARHDAVAVVECLLRAAGRLRAPADQRYDAGTVRAVRRHQAARRLPATGAVDRATWTSLVAAGRTPLLKAGTTGEPVRRLQRGLNAAMGRRLRVDGAFGPATARAVARYQARVGLRPTSVVTRSTWAALSRGEVAAPGQVAARR